MIGANSHVAVLGGGIGGWSVAGEIVRSGTRCTLIDAKPCAQGASTRNQGVLHSGAMYATSDEAAALECKSGQRWIQLFAPETVRDDVRCYYLFSREEELQALMGACEKLKIPAREVDLPSLQQREVSLQGAPRVRFAAQVGDRTVDSAQLLSRLVRQACEDGVMFNPVADLNAVGATWTGNRWRVDIVGGRSVECDCIVLACGTYIPRMLNRLLPGQQHSFVVTKSPVMVIHAPITQAILIPAAEAGPMIVPFRGNGRAGVTVTHLRQNPLAEDCSDFDLPDDFERAFPRALGGYYRGLEQMIRHMNSRGEPAGVHFYVCQKLSLQPGHAPVQSRQHIAQAFAPEAGGPYNLMVFYPGKFTSAPIVGRAVAKQVLSLFSTPAANLAGSGSRAPDVAVQRFYEEADHELVVRGPALTLIPLSTNGRTTNSGAMPSAGPQ